VALAGLFACAAYVYLLLGPLVFDAGYWVLGKLGRLRGERRWRAAQRVGLHVVPIVILDADDRLRPGAIAALLKAAIVGEPSSYSPDELTELASHMEGLELRRSTQALRAIWVLGNEYLTEAAPWTAQGGAWNWRLS